MTHEFLYLKKSKTTLRSRHLQESDISYKIYLYIFYVCAIIMASVTAFGIYAMIEEAEKNGTYVMGEVLVNTHVPFDNFANLSTWLFFSNIIGWYCVARIGWKKTAGEKIKGWKMALLQLMLLGFAIICLYELFWNFSVLTAQITAGIVNGNVPDIDKLTVAYPAPDRPWNLIFGTKVFFAAFICSAHAFYLSTRPRKSLDDLEK